MTVSVFDHRPRCIIIGMIAIWPRLDISIFFQEKYSKFIKEPSNESTAVK
jgi:hypothetical protein